MNVLIIANGNINRPHYYENLISKADKIICADGGYHNAKKIGITPDIIIGDMDSLDIKNLHESMKDKLIIDKDQDKTDFELAIAKAKQYQPEKITIIGAIGTRLDHSLANMMCLEEDMEILDENNIVNIVKDRIELEGKKGDIVSVFAKTNFTGLDYTGLKWILKDYSGNAGWFAVSNRMTGKKAIITVKKGTLIVMRSID